MASLARAMTSWRTASVTLLSFSSGLPLGLVWIAIPDWLRKSGVDIRLVGLFTLAQTPWTFKFLWSPLMDRYSPPWLGRRLGWVALSQVALLGLLLAVAGLGDHPDAPWLLGALALAIAFASATHDIAYDAYTVDVLRPEEQGIAVGARTAMYRTAMYVAGGLAITLAGAWSWPAVNAALALLYLPMLLVTLRAPEPPVVSRTPSSLREAVWHPLLGFLARHRALEILAFVFFYKFADNLAVSLLRPFLFDMGYGDGARGVGVATAGIITTVLGTIVGGAMTTPMGLGHALWVFGALQIFSNVGYVLVARSSPDLTLMYAATGFDNLTTGLGMGAFSVLLLRLTQKRFSATQYALFSSLFGLPRIVAGPISGLAVHHFGWEAFFWMTMIAGIPGMALLHRFAPVGRREPTFELRATRSLAPLTRAGLIGRASAGAAVALIGGSLLLATMASLERLRAPDSLGFDLAGSLAALWRPSELGGWIRVTALAVFAGVAGLATAAVFAARHGAGRELTADQDSGAT